MKSNELRIGNYINHKDLGTIKLTQKQLLYLINDKNYCDNCSFVPITKDWMLVFNFKLEWGTCFKLNDFEIRYWRKFWYYPNKMKRLQIKYVHQLQNLYYALTDEELKLCSNS